MFRALVCTLALLVTFGMSADVQRIEALEREMWGFIKQQKWQELDKRIAPYFQAAQFDGARTKEQYMSRIQRLNIGEYQIRDMHVTESTDLVVVSYRLYVSETIQGKRLSTEALRLSVWQKAEDDWQWISHIILVPVPTAKPNTQGK